jgi:hypothetical protein
MSEPGSSPENAAPDADSVDAARRADRRTEPQPEDSTQPQPTRPREIGGRGGPDPTRYGDWEYKGRCIDF